MQINKEDIFRKLTVFCGGLWRSFIFIFFAW